MRLFFAIPVTPDIKKKLRGGFPAGYRPGVRFTVSGQLHITLHFMGAAERDRLPLIISMASEILKAFPSFELKFEGFKLLQKERRPVMIWAELANPHPFEKLSADFRNVFPTSENRKPDPHITIARIKQLKQLPFELPSLQPFTFKATTVELLESVTHESGAMYKLIDRWELV